MGDSHPWPSTDWAALASAADLPEDVRDVVVGWIEDRARAFRNMAGDRQADGDLTTRIETVMPARKAGRIVTAISACVLAEHGPL